MRGRKYTKKIAFYQVTETQNDYGDTNITDSLIFNTWCQIITDNQKGNNRSTEFGQTETSDRLIINLRKRDNFNFNSKDLYVLYRGLRYNIISEPINIGFEDREIQIILRKSNE